MIKKTTCLMLVLWIMFALSGCVAEKKDTAGMAVQDYLAAIVSGDENRIAALSCQDWESTARGEVASFAGVKARLEALSCQTVTPGGQEAIVQCSGAIVATYNNEDQTFELANRSFKVVQQNSEWLVCGYGG